MTLQPDVPSRMPTPGRDAGLRPPPPDFLQLASRAYMAYQDFEVARTRAYAHCRAQTPDPKATIVSTRRDDPIYLVKFTVPVLFC